MRRIIGVVYAMDPCPWLIWTSVRDGHEEVFFISLMIEVQEKSTSPCLRLQNGMDAK